MAENLAENLADNLAVPLRVGDNMPAMAEIGQSEAPEISPKISPKMAGIFGGSI